MCVHMNHAHIWMRQKAGIFPCDVHQTLAGNLERLEAVDDDSKGSVQIYILCRFKFCSNQRKIALTACIGFTEPSSVDVIRS